MTTGLEKLRRANERQEALEQVARLADRYYRIVSKRIDILPTGRELKKALARLADAERK